MLNLLFELSFCLLDASHLIIGTLFINGSPEPVLLVDFSSRPPSKTISSLRIRMVEVKLLVTCSGGASVAIALPAVEGERMPREAKYDG